MQRGKKTFLKISSIVCTLITNADETSVRSQWGMNLTFTLMVCQTSMCDAQLLKSPDVHSLQYSLYIQYTNTIQYNIQCGIHSIYNIMGERAIGMGGAFVREDKCTRRHLSAGTCCLEVFCPGAYVRASNQIKSNQIKFIKLQRAWQPLTSC